MRRKGMTDFLEKVNEGTQKALKVLKRIENEKKFSEFAREKFNEVGFKTNSSKAEEMLETLHKIGVTAEKDEDKIKAIKVFAEMVGGGLNERQTNIQNNNYGNVFLEMLSNK